MTAFTSDPAKVVMVVWNMSSNAPYPEWAGSDDTPEKCRLQEKRWKAAATILHMKCQREYPNAKRIEIHNGGFENEWTQVGERANTSDLTIYEPFFDEMTKWEQEACAYAIAVFPEDENL